MKVSNSIHLLSISNYNSMNRYANKAAHFVDAYAQVSLSPAVRANRKYRGHHTLPSEILGKLKDEFTMEMYKVVP